MGQLILYHRLLGSILNSPCGTMERERDDTSTRIGRSDRKHLRNETDLDWPDIERMRRLLHEAVLELRKVTLPPASDASHRS